MRNFPTAACIFILTVAIGTAALPRAAEAQLEVHDPISWIQAHISATANAATAGSANALVVKEYGLDSIAWTVSKQAIQMMTKSVVNWINSGFNGSPAFVTNLNGYMLEVGDIAAGQFLNQLGTNPAIKSPFQTVVWSLAETNYLKSTASNGFFLQNPYTLNQYTTNDAAFLNGTSFQGGWAAWLAAGNTQNNPLGAYYLAQSQLNGQLLSAQQIAQKTLDWGQGFLSWCGQNTGGQLQAPTITGTPGGTLTTGVPTLNGTGYLPGTQGTANLPNTVNASTAGQAHASNCLQGDGTVGTIQTPGSVIQAQLNHTLGLSGDQLVTADEFNEIIGALISQLVTQTLSAGLSSLSQPSSNGSSYLDQATNPSQYASSTSVIADTLAQSIGGSQNQVQQYQAEWSSIGSEASFALIAGTSTCPDTLTPPPAVKMQADAAIATSTAALATLQKISADESAATGTGTTTQASAYQTVGTEYQNFLISGMPSAADLANAQTQSQETGTTTPASLFTQMEHITNHCVAN